MNKTFKIPEHLKFTRLSPLYGAFRLYNEKMDAYDKLHNADEYYSGIFIESDCISIYTNKDYQEIGFEELL
jgi:hypothetical protein